LVRNVNKLYGEKLYSELDRSGLEFNASTYSEMVQFYTHGSSARFEMGAQLISRLLSPIVLSVDEIAAERRRIKAEIRESEDKNSLASFSSSVIYEGCSLSNPILGTNRTVDRISRSRLESYRRRVFTPENVFIYVTGSFTDADIAALSALVGAATLYDGAAHTNIAPVPPLFGRRGAAVQVKNAGYTAVRFNFDVDMARIRGTVLDLIYDILFSGYSAPLFCELSEKMGICYDISGAIERYKNIGSFNFSFEVAERDIYRAIETTVGILRTMRERAPREEDCMKAAYVDNGALLYDDARELNFTMAYDAHVMGEPYSSLDDRRAAYGAVTPDMILVACRELFVSRGLTLTVMGNKKKINVKRIGELLSALEDL
jgi:predicted Zn-dependent peptidase